MPPLRFSRYIFSAGTISDEDDVTFLLLEREPFRFRQIQDNRTHIAKEGDTLFTLAHKFYSGLPRPAGLWWVIADFQPEPIHDPTIKLANGRVMIIPSIRTVIEDVFAEERRTENAP